MAMCVQRTRATPEEPQPAAELLDRARRGEFTVHMPNVCLGEARQAIQTKCQPRSEANAIRRFLTWAQAAGDVTPADATATNVVLNKYESSLKQDLANQSCQPGQHSPNPRRSPLHRNLRPR